MSLQLRDVYQVRPQKAVLDMDTTQKQQLLDSAVSKDEEGKRRGLIITFDLSSSLRRTNNRLYTPKGQRDHVDSWTTPYPKPIIIQHERSSDPIGRFIEVKWVPNDDQAMPFFESLQDFMEFKRIAESNNPQRIYKEMLKRNLLTNDAWPGIGRLVAKARITDPEAIEKFLDGRYLTFSAGSHTDRYVCGQCGSDWANGDVCDHPPGSISDEGLPGVFITGAFYGDEGSVVTVPGNNLSLLRSMEFGDAAGDKIPEDAPFLRVSDEIQFTDAIVDTGDIMATAIDKTKQIVDSLKTMDARDIARALWDSTLTEEQVDALGAKSHFETGWLVRVHDALHSEYDWRLRWSEEDAVEVPDAVFAFHGDLHELSNSKGFRDSFANGALDGFNKAGEVSDEYVSKRIKAKDEEKAPTGATLLEDADFLAKLKEQLKELIAETPEPTQETEDGVQEEALQTEAEEAQEEGEEVNDSQETEVDLSGLDWFLVGTAFRAELGDAKLGDEALAALEDEVFLGPERAVPLADSAHVDAARTVVEKIKCSDEQRAALVAALDARTQALHVPECTCGSADKIAALQKDYAEALELATKTQDQLDSLQNKLDALDSTPSSVENESRILNVEDIKAVDNPSGSSADALAPLTTELGDYERKIVSRYKELRDSEGEAYANRYLRRKIAGGTLPRSFDITNYIQENE